MEPMLKSIQTAVQSPIHKPGSEGGCVHGRLIDAVRTRGGKLTGKVRCLECQAIIDDPYHRMK